MPAQADPDLALKLAQAVADLYGEATERLLRIVAARLARGIDQPGWAEAKLTEVTLLRDEARKVVQGVAADLPGAVTGAIESAYQAGAAAGDRELGTFIEGTLKPSTNQRAVEALARETIAKTGSTHTQILRNTEDAYRQVIARSTGQTITGSGTRRQATQQALDEWAKDGITGFRDKAGRRWEIQSYAEMATRTATGRAQVAGTLDRFQANDRDLVIVSNAPEECKVCRPWEGKVLSISGTDDRYPSLEEAQGDGLLHANCRHRLGLYVPGLTKPLSDTTDPDGDTMRQEQRFLEREKRRALRERAVALDDKERAAADRAVNKMNAELRSIVKDRKGYAERKADYLEGLGHPGAKKWRATAERLPAGSEGKRLPYREQISKAR